jgi:D-serine deaminase-like pyridoxal phosphate-dependent protein
MQSEELDSKNAAVEDIDTPCLVANLDQVERNLKDMQEFADKMGKKLRPHSKTHKSPEMAKKQIALGAVGVCTQKVSEAEVLVNNGVRDVLISNEVIGISKLRRFAELAKRSTMSICIDSREGVEQLAQVSRESGALFSCLVDVDVGMHRCGVEPSQAGKLASFAASMGLDIRGMMGYEGHVGHHPRGEWDKAVAESMNAVETAKRSIQDQGIKVSEVVVGGTPTAKISGKYSVVTDITPGEYIYYDYSHVETGICRMQDVAMSIYCTVMSKPTEDRAVIDGGWKTFDYDQTEYPRLRDESLGARFASFSEEHGVLRLTDEKAKSEVKIGSRLEFVPYHICTCVNLHDRVNLARKGKVEGILPTLGRGMVS